MAEDGSAESRRPAADAGPSLLVERPKIRWFWFGVLAFMAGLIIAVVAWITMTPGPDPGGEWAMVGFALLILLFGLGFLRVSLKADPNGVTVTDQLRRRRVAWADLEDVTLVEVQAPIQFGLHQLALVISDGRVIQTAATGLVKPGCRLERLADDLLAMRDRYRPTPDIPS